MVWNLDCCIKKILLDINFSARDLHLTETHHLLKKILHLEKRRGVNTNLTINQQQTIKNALGIKF